MTMELLQEISMHLDRIATSLEATTEASVKAAAHIATQDPKQQVQDVLTGLQSNPALAPIFAQVEKMMLGNMPNKQGEINASRSD